jgi:hypothetical protein
MPRSASNKRRASEQLRVALLPQLMKFKGGIATLVSAATQRKKDILDRINRINKKLREWFKLIL